MKNLFILSALIAMFAAACAPIVQEDGSSVKITKQPDLRLADNARLELAAAGNGDALYAALQTEARQPLRDGIIYSLGCMRYQPARDFIEKTALADKSPAAILALARYDGGEDSLKKLAAEGNQTAKSALFIKAKAPCQKSQRGAVSKAEDDNAAVAQIYTLCAKCPANLEFLLSYSAASDRVAEAQCNALGAMGGDAAARKILRIAAQRPKVAAAHALGLCAGSTDAILEALAAKNKIAVEAVKIGRVSEAESVLLKQISAPCCPEYKAAALEALEVVGAEATAKKFVFGFESIPQAELKNYVKIIAQAISRCGDADKAALLAKLGEIAKSDSPRKAAASRIINNK